MQIHSSPRQLSSSSTTDEPHSTTSSTASSSSSSSCGRRRRESTNSKPDHFAEDFLSFTTSGAPSRFLIYIDGSWVDFPRNVFDELSAGFLAGKAVVQLSVDGKNHIFDFVRKLRIDFSTGAENSIAWVDVNGRKFFPRWEREFETADERFESSGRSFPGTKKLNKEDKFYRVVEKLFLDGMRRVRTPGAAAVTSVHRCSYSGVAENLRLTAFQVMMGLTKAARGDANVKFGWYGASAETVARVVKHGFGRTNEWMLGAEAHGVGVHLSSPHFPYKSSLLSEADTDDKEKHIVLCRVIMGNSERVCSGSAQCHPSSDEFDSGVDDPINPKWYVVWSTHMNTHILPEYIVSFKSPDHHHRQGLQSSMKLTRRAFVPAAAVPGLSFQKLLFEMRSCLPSSNMQALEALYYKHKAGSITKEAFIRQIRAIAGDKLLASTIKRIRGHILVK